MAYPIPQYEGLAREQAEILRELNGFQQISESAAWKQLIAKMQEMVDEAQEGLLGCAPTLGAEKRGILSIRWQQREAMRRGVMQFVEAKLNERNQLVEEIKEQEALNGNISNSGDPGTDNQ